MRWEISQKTRQYRRSKLNAEDETVARMQVEIYLGMDLGLRAPKNRYVTVEKAGFIFIFIFQFL